MSNILIVEKDANTRNDLVAIAKNISTSSEVYEASTAGEALEVAEKEDVGAFFLDIKLEDYSGLELAKRLRGMDKYKFTPIAFISEVRNRELEAFRHIHCYKYILKPSSENKIAQVFQEVITHGVNEQETVPIIKIKEKRFTYILKQEDLVFIEVMNRNLFIKTIYEETDMTSCTLPKLAKQLSDKFIQCHKSFIVNVAYIKKIDRINNVLHVHHKDEPIPIGRKYKDIVWGLDI